LLWHAGGEASFSQEFHIAKTSRSRSRSTTSRNITKQIDLR
jgi:hypothetical protein